MTSHGKTADALRDLHADHVARLGSCGKQRCKCPQCRAARVIASAPTARKGTPPISDDIRAEVARLLESGLNTVQAAKAAGVSTTTAWRIRREARGKHD